MKKVSADSQRMLESLRKAVSQALEKKKRLGQYAVVWGDDKPVVIKGDLISDHVVPEQWSKS